MSVWLLTLLLHITCAADVRMAHARPFSTSMLQELFNDIKNTSRRGVLTPAIEFWIFRSPKGLPSPRFGSVSVILTLLPSGVATLSPTESSISDGKKLTNTKAIYTFWCDLQHCSKSLNKKVVTFLHHNIFFLDGFTLFSSYRFFSSW